MKVCLASFIIYYAMIKSMGTSCITVFTWIRILPHYDEYERVCYKTDYDTYVRHDDKTTDIFFRCSATTRQRVLAKVMCEPSWWGHICTCGLCLEKYYTSNLAQKLESRLREWKNDSSFNHVACVCISRAQY